MSRFFDMFRRHTPENGQTSLGDRAGRFSTIGPAWLLGSFNEIRLGRIFETNGNKGVIISQVFKDLEAMQEKVHVRWLAGPLSGQQEEVDFACIHAFLQPEFIEDDTLVPRKVLELQARNWILSDTAMQKIQQLNSGAQQWIRQRDGNSQPRPEAADVRTNGGVTVNDLLDTQGSRQQRQQQQQNIPPQGSSGAALNAAATANTNDNGPARSAATNTAPVASPSLNAPGVLTSLGRTTEALNQPRAVLSNHLQNGLDGRQGFVPASGNAQQGVVGTALPAGPRSQPSLAAFFQPPSLSLENRQTQAHNEHLPAVLNAEGRGEPVQTYDDDDENADPTIDSAAMEAAARSLVKLRNDTDDAPQGPNARKHRQASSKGAPRPRGRPKAGEQKSGAGGGTQRRASQNKKDKESAPTRTKRKHDAGTGAGDDQPAPKRQKASHAAAGNHKTTKSLTAAMVAAAGRKAGMAKSRSSGMDQEESEGDVKASRHASVSDGKGKDRSADAKSLEQAVGDEKQRTRKSAEKGGGDEVHSSSSSEYRTSSEGDADVEDEGGRQGRALRRRSLEAVKADRDGRQRAGRPPGRTKSEGATPSRLNSKADKTLSTIEILDDDEEDEELPGAKETATTAGGTQKARSGAGPSTTTNNKSAHKQRAQAAKSEIEIKTGSDAENPLASARKRPRKRTPGGPGDKGQPSGKAEKSVKKEPKDKQKDGSKKRSQKEDGKIIEFDDEYETDYEEKLKRDDKRGYNYTDASKWIKGWTGMYYPRDVACEEGDIPVGEEGSDDDDSCGWQQIMDYHRTADGLEWVLLKWRKYELDIGEGAQFLKKDLGEEDVKRKGHWEPVHHTFANKGARALFRRWLEGAGQDPWYRRQREIMDGSDEPQQG